MSKKIKCLVAGLAVVVFVFLIWILAPFVINQTGQELSPLTPTSAGNIPVLPDPDKQMPELIYTGTFVSGAHETSGLAQLIDTESGQIIRLQDLDTLNGPDLRVYLASDDTANEFIDLGPLKANRGDTNYVVPSGTDLDHYDTVLIWCRAFSVLFGSAAL